MSSITDITTNLTTPATAYWQWSSTEQKFQKWNKELEKREYADQLNFVLLNTTYFITGYSDAQKAGIYSNFIKNIKEQKFSVRYFNSSEVIAEGLYSEIKDKIKAVGGKYAQGWFIYNLDNQKIEHLEVSKSALSVLIASSKKTYLSTSKDCPFTPDLAQSLDGKKIETRAGNGFRVYLYPTIQKKGGTRYYVPQFENIAISKEVFNQALEKGREVDEYVQKYLSAKLQVDIVEQELPTNSIASNDDLPEIDIDSLAVEMPF
jgi:hypothetical protein